MKTRKLLSNGFGDDDLSYQSDFFYADDDNTLAREQVAAATALVAATAASSSTAEGKPVEGSESGGMIGEESVVAMMASMDVVANGAPAPNFTPGDSLFGNQWHLLNTGQFGGTPGIDLNVTRAWDNYTGSGVHVGIYDSGVQYTHHDLNDNYDSSRAVIIDGSPHDPFPVLTNPDNAHGTNVAGLIAAENDGTGTVGVAFDAGITGVNIFALTDAQFLQAWNQMTNFDVTNHSWGYTSAFADNRLLTSDSFWGPFFTDIDNAVHNGRSGLGTIIVHSAGNDRTNLFNSGEARDANDDNFTNSREVISVAALDNTGFVAQYSTPGAPVFVSAFGGGIDTPGVWSTDFLGNQGFNRGPGDGFTTDDGNLDYDGTMDGTSAASPEVAGVVALILQANPSLGWRDVQEILAISARHTGSAIGSAHTGWELYDQGFNHALDWNGGGMHFDNDYGFGLVDATAAVRLAETWVALSTSSNEYEVTTGHQALTLAVPDNNTAGVSFHVNSPGINVEHMELELDWSPNHTWLGDLVITVTSPTGTLSYLLNREGQGALGHGSSLGLHQTLPNWVFTSNAFRDESGQTGGSAGQWTVNISDRAGGDTGTIVNVDFSLFGSAPSADDTYFYTNEYATYAGLFGHSTVLSDPDGGTNTINAAAVSSSSTINLNPGVGGSIAGQPFSIASGTTIQIVYAGDGNDSITGNSAGDQLDGERGNDTIAGGSGNDTVDGGDGNDTLSDGQGTDNVFGGNGDDRLIPTDFFPSHHDLWNGGPGIDTWDASAVSFVPGVVINLSARDWTFSGNAATITNVENVEGSQGGETIIGDHGANVLDGNGGDDTIDGFLGNDTLNGGGGSHDVLSYSLDRAVVVNLATTTPQNTNGAGIDTVSNFEDLTGSYFNDTLSGDANANIIRGGGGTDIIKGGGGADTLIAGDPNASIVKPQSQSNSTTATAVNLDGHFGLQASDFIGNATTIPHATVAATASGNLEYYKFTVTAGAAATFDIDQTSLGQDTYLELFSTDGTTLLTTEDDSPTLDPGTDNGFDSFLNYTFASAGVYYLRVDKFPGTVPPVAGSTYTLTLSLGGATVTPVTTGSVLDGGTGDDTMTGGLGNDQFYVDSAGDVVNEAAGNGSDRVYTSVSYALTAGQSIESLWTTSDAGTSALVLTGNTLAQIIRGNAGNNTLDDGGVGGGDTMQGLGGNDTYDVNNSGDVVIEAAGGGTDHVVASASFALGVGQSVETMATNSSVATTAINLTGNALAQTITGNAGNNTLNDGGAGSADTMQGLGGNDTYIVNNSGDIVIEAAGGGTDRVLTSVSYTLGVTQSIEGLSVLNPASITATNLVGNPLAQSITGNAGNNTLNDGGAGSADTMRGLGGNDTYIVNNSGDIVIEAAGGGTDHVLSSVSFTLGGGQSIETLGPQSFASTTAINFIGNALAQSITGNAGNNTLNDGGAGSADTLQGLGGNDNYIVNNSGDLVLEAAGGGTDHVLTSVSFVLGAGQSVENFTPTSFASTTAINLTGNALAQSITGNAGNNTLNDGGAGSADTLQGLGGNDNYIVNNSGDAVLEAAGGGTDHVLASVSFTLGAGQEIESFTPVSFASTTNINLTGNALGQSIIGNAGNNVIDGKDGNDTLQGLGGNDTFAFDTALNAATNLDHIADFIPGTDKIELSHAVFTTLAVGNPLAATAFTTGAPTNANQHIIYNAATGGLSYDDDGNGAHAAIQFAIFNNHPVLANTDIFVV
jgi:Ca2+-binding RTX toxin-like protein